MKIARGAFRLSLIAAAAIFLYGVWSAFLKAGDESYRAHELWTTLRCGERLPKEDLSQYTNEYGNFDLGKLGCSHRTFRANRHEIETALTQTDPGPSRRAQELNWQLQRAGATTLIAFLTINFLGLSAVGLIYVARWVRDGLFATRSARRAWVTTALRTRRAQW
jgi:hypothetical protein